MIVRFTDSRGVRYYFEWECRGGAIRPDKTLQTQAVRRTIKALRDSKRKKPKNFNLGRNEGFYKRAQRELGEQ
jgi:hypothetical protein